TTLPVASLLLAFAILLCGRARYETVTARLAERSIGPRLPHSVPAPKPSHPAGGPKVTLAALPLSFEPAREQDGAGPAYLSRGPGYALRLSGTTAAMTLFHARRSDPGGTAGSCRVDFKLADANPD